jgi:gliding motility-associated-like protein
MKNPNRSLHTARSLIFKKIHPIAIPVQYLYLYLSIYRMRNSRLLFLIISVFSLQGLIMAQTGFMENKGQWNGPFQFKSSIPSGTVFFEPHGWTFHWADLEPLHAAHTKGQPEEILIASHAVQVKVKNGFGPMHWQGTNPGKTRFSYFLGNDPGSWVSGLHAQGTISAQDVWEGIACRFFSFKAAMKYEFVVDPGANPQHIQLEFEGAESVYLEKGRLNIETTLGTVTEESPIAYQLNEKGDTNFIACRFTLSGKRLGFELGSYDKSRTLIVDPFLVFGSFSGSTTDNWGYTATYDSDGFLYSGGVANGIGYPTTTGAFQTVWNGGHGSVFPSDVTLSKYDTTGSFMVWSTYLGGSGSELPHSLVVNNFDELFVYGTTGSADFPTTQNAFDVSFNGGANGTTTSMNINYNSGSDIFISRISANGTALQASTFVGGSGNDGLNQGAPLRFNYADEVRGEIIIDNLNNIYVATVTASSDFPITPNTVQTTYGGGGQDGVVFKMDNGLTSMIWGSYLGGSNNDAIYSLDLYNNDDLLVTGGTNSTNFPTANSPFNTYNGGISDGFAARFSANGNTLLNSMYVGSPNYDQNYFIQLDASENVYVLGQTNTPGTYYITNAIFNIPSGGQYIRKYAPDFSSLIWSTAFGTGDGNPDISPSAFLVDVCSKIYLSGWGGVVNSGFYTGSTTAGMPITPGTAFQQFTTGSDYYLMVMDDNANQLIYGSFYGGSISAEHVDGGTSRFDRKGMMYQSVCAGCGGNSDFPTTVGAHSTINSSPNCNNGVFKFSFDFPTTIADFNVPSSVCLPAPMFFQNNSAGATNYLWDFGDGSTSTLTNPAHTYAQSGVYEVTLYAFDNSGSNCNPIDSIKKKVVLLDNSSEVADTSVLCLGESKYIGLTPNGDPTVTYTWSPSLGLSDPNSSFPLASPTSAVTYRLILNNGTCADTLFVPMVVETLPTLTDSSIFICPGQSVLLGDSSISEFARFRWSPSIGLQSDSTRFTLATPLSDTTYKLVYSLGACTDSVQYSIEYRINGSIDLPTLALCPGDTIQLNQADTTGKISFNWIPATGLSNSSIPFPEAYPAQSTLYSLVASDGFCTDTFNQPILVLDPSTFAGTDKLICQGESVALGFNDTIGLGYQWSPATGLSNPNIPNPIASPLSSTIYVLNTFYPGQPGVCERTDTVSIDVHTEFPIAGFDWQASGGCLGMKLALNDLSQNADSTLWLVNGQPLAPGQTIAQIPYDSTAILTQIVWNGPCRDTLNLNFDGGSMAEYLKFVMPNVFTPNGDGLNELFCPVGLENEFCFTLWIYNRWGTRIFQSNGNTTCWNGVVDHSGVPASDGVYYYVILLDDNVTQEQGFLHLFR